MRGFLNFTCAVLALACAACSDGDGRVGIHRMRGSLEPLRVTYDTVPHPR
jgi:hypothetical protein